MSQITFEKKKKKQSIIRKFELMTFVIYKRCFPLRSFYNLNTSKQIN